MSMGLLLKDAMTCSSAQWPTEETHHDRAMDRKCVSSKICEARKSNIKAYKEEQMTF